MSEIRVRDMVMLVRGHSCAMERLGGIPFVVEALVPPLFGGYTCTACDAHSLEPYQLAAKRPGLESYIPLAWLLKIDPPPIETDMPTQEELTA